MNKRVDRISIYKIYSKEAKKQREEILKERRILKNTPHKQIKSK